MQIHSELVFSFILYTLLVPIHEILHYISARDRVVMIKFKPYGILMMLKSLTLRDILLPQLITVVLLLLYILTGRPGFFSTCLAHLVSSFLDFYAYVKFKKRSSQEKRV